MPAAYAKEYNASHPLPASEGDIARVEEQARRWRILNECWAQDAFDREADFFDQQLRDSMPTPELSRNPALMIFRQTSTLYDTEGDVSAKGAKPEDLERLDLPLLWAQSQERALYTEAINECVTRADWLDADGDGEGRIAYRVIPPHLIHHARTDHDDSSRLVYVEEVRWLDVGEAPSTTAADGTVTEGRPAFCGWVVEAWDLRAETMTRTFYKDATTRTESRTEPWPAAYYDTAGKPIMPYILYHRMVGGDTWSPMPGRGVFWGTLTTACLWTFWLFGFRDVSYDQRALLDGTIQGMSPANADPLSAQRVLIDPRVVLQIKSDGEKQAKLSQWSKTVDLKASGESIEQFMAGLAMYAGVSPSDITLGSSQKSGYSIVVSRDGQRKARRRQMVPSRIGDRLLLCTAARLLNRHAGTKLPTEAEDWSIVYAPVEMSAEERKTLTEEVIARLDAGLLSPVDAYRELNPGVSDEGATAALADIAQSRALLSAASTPTDQVAVIAALTSLGDKIPPAVLYWNLQRIGILPPDTDLAALVAPVETPPAAPLDEARDAAAAASELLSRLSRAGTAARQAEILDDLRETMADLLDALGGPAVEGGEE